MKISLFAGLLTLMLIGLELAGFISWPLFYFTLPILCLSFWYVGWFVFIAILSIKEAQKKAERAAKWGGVPKSRWETKLEEIQKKQNK